MSFPHSFQLLNSGAMDGFSNMAIDLKLVQLVQQCKIPAVLRFYQWNPYAVSIGYHQQIENIDLVRCQEEGIDVVRRPTGGRAVFHAEELTYSLIIPKINWSASELYNRISNAIASGLRHLGIPVEFASSSADFKNMYRSKSLIPCFSSSARFEIQVDGRKIVGSAQRRFSDAVLQHGSIIIGNTHQKLPEYLQLSRQEKKKLIDQLKNKTISIGEIVSVDLQEIKDALKSGFEDEWDITFDSSSQINYIGYDKRNILKGRR